MSARSVCALACAAAGMVWAGPAATGTALVCRNGPVDVLSGGPAATRCGAAATATAAPPQKQGDRHAAPEPALRVDAQTQRTRDEGRKAILSHELAQEQARLAALLKAGGSDAAELGRTRANIAALERELVR